MKTVAKLGIGLFFVAGLAFSIEEYRGKLLDASCYNNSSTSQRKATEKLAQTCAPTASTGDFALQIGGKVRKLDAAGNSKAVTAFKDGLLKSDKDGDFPVIITGWRKGDTMKVESVRGHKSDTSVH